MRTNLRREGDAHNKKMVPGFSQRQETAPLRRLDAASSLYPKHSNQHSDLGATSHKGRYDMCGRQLLIKHLHCKINKNQQYVTHFIHNQGKASQSETKLIILSSFSLDSMWSEAASHGQLASI
jgi:hypothetical protein